MNKAIPLKMLPREGWLQWPQTRALAGAFAQGGVPLRFVGGAVRDALLDLPVKDVDAATPAPPQKVMAVLEAAGIKVVPTGLSHGTVTAVINGKSFEITTLRRDVKTYGRHAEVLFTDDWKQDAERRDFTMNALYCDPDGTLHDYFDGARDAREGNVRFIGDPVQRIAEDGLRILRFFRFSAHYGQDAVDADGLNACHRHRKMLEGLSGERIQQEMLKLLQADRAAEMLTLMRQADLLPFLFAGTVECDGLAAWPKVRLMADVEPDATVALALLLRSGIQTRQMLEALAQRWKLSGKLAGSLKALVTCASLETDLSEAGQKSLLRAMGAESFRRMVLVSWAERLSETPKQSQLLSAAYRSMLGLADRWQPPEFPLSGDDLQAKGLAPGPELGDWLKRLEQWWEQENYRPDKAELLKHFESQM